MNNKLKNQIFSGLIWKFGERFLAQGVSFVISVILSRLLTPNDYGIVAMILIFINIANVFVTSGFSTALVQNKDADDVDFSTNFFCSLAMSIVVCIIMYFVAPVIANFYKLPELTLIIRVFSLRIPLSAFSAIQHAYVERYMLFKRYFYSTLTGTLFSGIIGIIFAYKGYGVWALIAQYFTNTILDIVVLLFTIEWRPKFVFSKKSALTMMDYGSKILLADLSGTFFNELRSLIIGKIYTSSDLAFYNKGNQLPNLITINVTSSIMTVLFPAISNINDDSDRVVELTKKSTKIIAYIIMPMLLLMACISKSLIIILFTSKWIDVVPYIQILSIACAIGMIGSVSLQTIKAVGRSDIVLKLEFIKKPIYILLLLLGAIISPIAIAITMLLYNIYSTIVNAFELSKVISYPLSEQLLDLSGTFAMSMIMCIFIYPLSFLNLNNYLIIFLQISIGILVYWILSIILKNESYIVLKKMIGEVLYAQKNGSIN